MASWKIEKRPENERDEWLNGYSAVAGAVGVWGCAMWIVSKLFNNVKLTKNDDETTNEEE